MSTMKTGPKKKIAVCFYGQVRFYEIFNLFYKHVIKQNLEFEIDFFIATWNDFDSKKVDFNFTKSKYFNHDRVTRKWKSGNTQKVAFLVNQVAKLKQEIEIRNDFHYDAVLLIRPDIVFQPSDLFKTLKYFTSVKHSRPSVVIPDTFYLDESNAYRIDSDWMFIFTSEALDIHSTLYNYFYLQKKYKNGGIPYTEGGHWIHAHYFMYNNFFIESKKFPTEVIRPKRDIEVLRNLYDKPHFLDKLIKHRVIWEKQNIKESLTAEQAKFIKSPII